MTNADKLARLLRQIEIEARREEVLALCRQSEKPTPPAPSPQENAADG